MKKKPPPGATLIARLKEQRLAREAELARRQEGAATAASEPEAPPKSEPKSEPKSDTAAAPAAPVKEPPRTAARQSSEEKRSATSSVETTIIIEAPTERQNLTVTKPARDLIHREIDFDDLRPTSEDYFVLTDEIRLAGRFAAVGLIAQGLRLYKLKDVEIYKEHYQTFEDYCRKEHQMSATYAYRLIRMAEMAEQVARLEQAPLSTGSDHMPDPFEVMIGLGHRHLMALLPLEAETAQELLVRGVPVSGADRVPISRATEKQIREALKTIAPGVTNKTATRVRNKTALVSEKQLIPALSKLVEMLEDWAVWLDGDPPAELQAARMGRGPLLNRLAKRFRAASGKIAGAIEVDEDK
jgi:hypothetical protein